MLLYHTSASRVLTPFSLSLDFGSFLNYHSFMSDDSNSKEQKRSVRKRAKTRADLLAAARKVFAERGFYDASIAEITELADVGVGTFYLYFRDKEEAFSTMLDEGFREMQGKIAADLYGVSSISVPQVVTTVFKHAYANRALFQSALTARGQGARVFRAQSELVDVLMKVLEQPQVMELLEQYDLVVLARMMAGMITQGIFWWFESEEVGPEIITEQVLLFLRHGLPEKLFASNEEGQQ